METQLTLGKLSREDMGKLLQDCYREQRVPKKEELCIPTPKKTRVTYTSERTGTGLFDILDDDMLAELLSRLPVKMRIVFAKSLCKQFAAVAYTHKVFKALCLSPYNRVCDTKEVQDKTLITVGNWSFLGATQIEELSIREQRGQAVDLPPAENLKGLSKLALSHVNAPTVKKLNKTIDASKLKELDVKWVNGVNDTIALLTKSHSLERLTLVQDFSHDYKLSKIIDAWCTVHHGFPPLRYLSLDGIKHKVGLKDLEKLDLEELDCSYLSDSIDKAYLPSVRTLGVSISSSSRSDAIKRIPIVKTLVASCPGLQTLMVFGIKSSLDSSSATVLSPAAEAIREVMKTDFPMLNVRFK